MSEPSTRNFLAISSGNPSQVSTSVTVLSWNKARNHGQDHHEGFDSVLGPSRPSPVDLMFGRRRPSATRAVAPKATSRAAPAREGLPRARSSRRGRRPETRRDRDPHGRGGLAGRRSSHVL